MPAGKGEIRTTQTVMESVSYCGEYMDCNTALFIIGQPEDQESCCSQTVLEVRSSQLRDLTPHDVGCHGLFRLDLPAVMLHCCPGADSNARPLPYQGSGQAVTGLCSENTIVTHRDVQ